MQSFKKFGRKIEQLLESSLLEQGCEGEIKFAQASIDIIFSENKVSENRYCRQPGAATIDAETYLTLLESSRLHRDLVQEYHGQGERSVEEAAKLVGLRLPEQYSPE